MDFPDRRRGPRCPPTGSRGRCQGRTCAGQEDRPASVRPSELRIGGHAVHTCPDISNLQNKSQAPNDSWSPASYKMWFCALEGLGGGAAGSLRTGTRLELTARSLCSLAIKATAAAPALDHPPPFTLHATRQSPATRKPASGKPRNEAESLAGGGAGIQFPDLADSRAQFLTVSLRSS